MSNSKKGKALLLTLFLHLLTLTGIQFSLDVPWKSLNWSLCQWPIPRPGRGVTDHLVSHCCFKLSIPLYSVKETSQLLASDCAICFPNLLLPPTDWYHFFKTLVPCSNTSMYLLFLTFSFMISKVKETMQPIL